MADVKETLEALKALEVLAKAVGKVVADGKVDLSDASALVEVALQASVLQAGFEGLAGAKQEAQDLQKEEAVQVAEAAWAIGDAFEAGRKGE